MGIADHETPPDDVHVPRPDPDATMPQRRPPPPPPGREPPPDQAQLPDAAQLPDQATAPDHETPPDHETLPVRARLPDRWPGSAGTGRRVLRATLVLVAALLLLATTTMTWLHRTVLDSDGWADTVAAVGSDPTVVEAVSRRITDELVALIRPEDTLRHTLPAGLAGLAGLADPLAGRFRDVLATQVRDLVESDAFQRLWVAANRFTHDQIVSVLRGSNAAVSSSDGQVTLNLLPLLGATFDEVERQARETFHLRLTLPTIGADAVPVQACRRLADALDRPVSDRCGQVVLFPADRLRPARLAVAVLDHGPVFLGLSTLVTGLAAVLLARGRRARIRAGLGLALTAAAVIVVFRAGLALSVRQAVGRIRITSATDLADRAAARAVADHVLGGLRAATTIELTVLLVVAALAAAALLADRRAAPWSRWNGRRGAPGPGTFDRPPWGLEGTAEHRGDNDQHAF